MALTPWLDGCGSSAAVRAETYYTLGEGGSVEWNLEDFAFKVRVDAGKLLVEHDGRTVELRGAPQPAKLQLDVTEGTLTLTFPEGPGLTWGGENVRRGGAEHRLAKPGSYILEPDGTLAGPARPPGA